MTNYIPKMSDAVLELNGSVILVITEKGGNFIPFVFKNGKPQRADGYIKSVYRVDEKVYPEMMAQVGAIFSSRKTKSKNVVIKLSTIKPSRNYSLEELDRIILLAHSHIEIASDGSLVIHRFKKEKAGLKEIIQPFKTDDAINAAIRSQQHIVKGYKSIEGKTIVGRIQKLIGIQKVLQNANDLLYHWHDFFQQDKTNMEGEIESVVASLKRCSNLYKVLVWERMQNFTGIRDSLGRVNPPAYATKTAAAMADITKGINEANRLFMSNAIKENVLTVEKLHEEMNIKHACLILKAVITSSDKTLDNYGVIELRINQALYYLQSVWAKPYFSQAEKARVITNIAKKFCQEKKFDLARLFLSAAVTILEQ